MTYNDVCLSLGCALVEFENLTNCKDCTIFMSWEFYKKAESLVRETVTFVPGGSMTFMGRPVEVIDCPGEKLWVGKSFPIKECIK